MRYPEELICPMREDLTRHGVQEARHGKKWTTFCSATATLPC